MEKARGYLKKDGIVNHIQHPTVPDAILYFVLDPPHAFKCVRNQIYNLNLVQAGGMCLSFEDIKRLTLQNREEI
jgi:hypothetical protein